MTRGMIHTLARLTLGRTVSAGWQWWKPGHSRGREKRRNTQDLFFGKFGGERKDAVEWY